MRIAIVGGGIGGLAAALALQRSGREIIVYEQAGSLGDVGAGVQLSPNAVHALRRLGVVDALSPHVIAPEAIELRLGSTDKLLIRSPLGAAVERRFGAPYWHVRRSDLQRVLLEAVRSRGSTIRLGERLSAPGRLDADLVVGADGVWSAMRRACNPGESSPHAVATLWRGATPLSLLDASAHPLAAVVRLGKERHFVSYRVGGDAVNFVGVITGPVAASQGWNEAPGRNACLADFGDWSPAVRALVTHCPTPRRWTLWDRDPARRWRDGRLVLLGDAAHPVPPHLAQGAALALEDAVVLGRTVESGPTMASVLSRYETARRGRAERVLAASRRQGRLLQLGGLSGAVAHAGLRLADLVAPGAPVRSLDWLYAYDAGSAPV